MLLASCSITKALQTQLNEARLATAPACNAEYPQTVRVSVLDSLGTGLFAQPLVVKTQRRVLPLLLYYNVEKEDLLYLGRPNLAPNLTGNLACHMEAALAEAKLHDVLGPGELTLVIDSVAGRLPYYEDSHGVFAVYTVVSWAEVRIGPADLRCRVRYLFKPDGTGPALVGLVRFQSLLPEQEGTVWDGPKTMSKSYLPLVMQALDTGLARMAGDVAVGLARQAPR